jgi:metal-sulfur cluster biosynthetic enzyme
MSTALRDKVIEVLKGIYDPEIPVNIYEIGLIYEVNVDDEAWRQSKGSNPQRSRSPGTRPGIPT